MIGGNARLGAAFAGDLHVAFSQFLNFDKAQDAVERRADVVAHAREESGFGGVGGIGFLPFLLCAVKRPDKDDDAGEQNANDDCRNDDAVAVKEVGTHPILAPSTMWGNSCLQRAIHLH